MSCMFTVYFLPYNHLIIYAFPQTRSIYNYVENVKKKKEILWI